MSIKSFRLLLADDDKDDCLFFKEAIEGVIANENFTAVHDGEQLMQWLENKINQLPDILFLDLNMPRKNGFECLAEIKQNKKLDMLPVVIFSTSFEQEVVNQLYINGATYFIRKPSEFSQFKKIILHTLSLLIQKNILQPNTENFVLTAVNT
ncbi:response regulator [Ferruginibacter sp.]